MARKRTVGLVGTGVVTNAVVTLTPQVLALVVLTPTDYATFGVLFIALGLTYSAQSSTVIDPWVRGGANSSNTPGGPLVLASTTLGLLASVIPVALGHVTLEEFTIALLGLIAAQLRWGMRLIEVGCGRWATAVVSDAWFLTGFAIATWLMWGEASWLTVWVPLIAGSTLSLIAHRKVLFLSPRSWPRWFAERRRIIAPLWLESTVLDVGVAAPLLILAKVMPAADFAVVRAASSALLPVRLILAPLRGWIATRRPDAVLGPRYGAGLLAVAALMGIAIGVALEAVGGLPFAKDGVLPLVAEYAIPIGAMGALQCMSVFFYMVSRGHASPRDLLVGRVLDTANQLVAVVSGYALAGIDGVMAAYVLMSGASLAIWAVVVFRSDRRAKASGTSVTARS